MQTKSSEVIDEALGGNVKQYDETMNRSPALIYKWIAGTTPNPVDDIINIYKSTGDLCVIEYLCQNHDGYFVKNTHEMDRHEFVNKMLSEIGDIIVNITESDADEIWTREEIEELEKRQAKLNSIITGFTHEMKKKLLVDKY